MTSLGIVEPRQPDFIDGWMKDYYEGPVKLRTERIGFGKKPALLVIDLQKDMKLVGLPGRAVQNTAILLSKARKTKIPVFYTVIGYRADGKDTTINKLGAMVGHLLGTESVEVHDGVRPSEEDVVLVKKGNSGFMGTDLLMQLTKMGIDTVIIAGCHTSGCIRATATDSYTLGFRTILAEECVGDGKGINPHKANLCDLHIRGADVITLEEILHYLGRLDRRELALGVDLWSPDYDPDSASPDRPE